MTPRPETRDDWIRELTTLAAAVTTATERHRDALDRRNALLARLRRDGIGATDLARVMSETRPEPLHRVSVARILSDAGIPDTSPDRAASRRFGVGVDRHDDRHLLAAAQALVDQTAAAITRAIDARTIAIVEAGEVGGIGATAQAPAVGIHRENVQRTLDEHRGALRRATTRTS